MDCLHDNVEPFTDRLIIDHSIPQPLASYPSLKLDTMDLRSILIWIYLSTFRMHSYLLYRVHITAKSLSIFGLCAFGRSFSVEWR
jgi:hypothetical protein